MIYLQTSKLRFCFIKNGGGGYWVWKPWVIVDALSHLNEDDILVYSDSGNEVFVDKEWHRWFELLDKKCNGLFFQYGGIMKKWTRRNMLSFYKELPHLKEYYQIQSGLILVKKKALKVIVEWLDLMLAHPEFIVDVNKSDLEKESPCFKENRHDQAALSCIVYKNEQLFKLKVIWQNSESRHKKGQACFNARISDNKRRSAVGKYEPWYVSVIKKLLLSPYRRIRMFILRKLDKR